MRLGKLNRSVVLAVWGAAAVAFGQNDLRITDLGNPLQGGLALDANTNWQVFAKQMGAALTSVNLTPPETVGHAAWALSVELGVVYLNGVTPVDADADGAPDPLNADQFHMPTLGAGFQSRAPLLMPSVHFRKGLPFSFEFGTRVAWLDKSSMFAGSWEIKWAVNEGFAYLPDVGLRIHGNKLFNTENFEVGAGGLDIGVGKQFAIGGMVTLTPYGGWNLVFVGAETGKPLDFDPTRSYADSISTVDAMDQGTVAYDPIKMFQANSAHNRFYAGVRFVGGIVQIAVEGSFSAMGQIPLRSTTGNRAVPGLGVLSVTAGLDY